MRDEGRHDGIVGVPASSRHRADILGSCGAPSHVRTHLFCSRSPARYPDAGEAKTMPTITFDMPESALSALRLSPTEFVKEMRVAAALLWYSHGELSQSKAAEIAGTIEQSSSTGSHIGASPSCR